MQIPDGKTARRIVVFSHDPDFGICVADRLGGEEYQVIYARTLEVALKELSETRPDAILFDRSLSHTFGDAAFHLIRSIYPRVPAITLSLSAGARAPFLPPLDFLRLGEFLAELTPAAEPPRAS